MATQQELLNQASEIRDAELEGENTAVRVGTMLINLIEYLSNFVSTDVLANYVTAAALDAATVGMQTSLNKKADIILMSNTRKLRIDEWPLVSLYSTELVQDTDAPENKMWWSAENSKLKYKHSGVVYEIGDPAYTLYYCGYKIFKWTGSGFAEMKVSVINNLTAGGIDTPLSAEQGKILKVLIDNEILARSNGDSAIAGYISSLQSAINEETSARQSAINEETSARQSADNQKTDKDQYTSKLTYSQAPDVVLASMGATLDNAGSPGGQHVLFEPHVGDTYWDPESCHIKYKESATETRDLGEPNPGLVYCNKRTNLTYRWAGSSGWKQVGGAPSSAVTVVNDLTTGGEDDALSAEMGKELNERLENVEENGTTGGISIDYDAANHRIVFGDAAVMQRVIVSPLSLVFQSTESGSSKTKTFTVKGVNLSAGIDITLADSTGFFSISANSISASNANSQNTITVTYAPTATGSHSASIAITSGTITKTVTVSGTAVEEVVPSLEVNGGDDIDLSAESGETVTATVHVSGNNLTPGSTVAIAASGSLSVSPASLTVDNSGEVDADVTVSWTASSSDIAETLTASSSTDNVSDSVDINGTVVAPLAEGTTFRKNDMLWTVKADGSLKVKQVSTTVPSGNIIIPATLNDLGATEADGATPVSGARGATYNVTEIEENAFKGSNYISSMIVSEGITTIGNSAFGRENGNRFQRLVLPGTITTIGTGNNSSDAPRNMLVFASGFNVSLPQKTFWTKCPKVVILTKYTGTETFPSLYKGTGIYGSFLQYSDSLKYGYDSIDKTLYVPDQATKDHVLTLTNYDNFAGGVHLISELDADDQNFINSLLQ